MDICTPSLHTGGTLRDLGTLGGNSSYAYGINDAGDVVGYSYVDAAGVSHAFLFENGIMIDLNDLIDPNSGWTLTEAYAINSGGQIVGAGIFDGAEHAFRLDLASIPGNSLADAAVPEPSTFSLSLIAATMVFLWRLRLHLRQRVLQPAPRRSGASLH